VSSAKSYTPGVWDDVPCGSVHGVQQDDGSYLIVLADEIDISIRSCIDEVTRAAFGAGGQVVVDTRNVTFMDASGVGLLVSLHRELAAQGRAMRLTAPSSATSRILSLLGLDDVLASSGDPSTTKVTSAAQKESR
jgi:anti-sigma B factor antagonist